MDTWIVRMKNGEERTIVTRGGLDMKAALDNAGIMQFEIEWIRAPHVEVVEDIREWRNAPGWLPGSDPLHEVVL